MTIAEQITRAKTDYDEVYEAGHGKGFFDGYHNGLENGSEEGYNNGYTKGETDGRQAVYKEMFDDYQKNGTRTDYRYAFRMWEEPMFYPQHDINLVGSNAQMIEYFGNNTNNVMNLKERLKECGVVLDTSKATNLNNMFYYSRISHIPTISFEGTSGNVIGVFSSPYIESIEKIVFKETADVPLQNIFAGATKLTDLRVEGVIFSNFNISPSPIDAESARNIIEHLKDYSGTTTTYTLTLSTTTKANLTETDIATITQKGWTLA